MYKIDEQVSYKGSLYDVVSLYGGMIKIKKGGEIEEVRVSEVSKVDIGRKYKV